MKKLLTETKPTLHYTLCLLRLNCFIRNYPFWAVCIRCFWCFCYDGLCRFLAKSSNHVNSMHVFNLCLTTVCAHLSKSPLCIPLSSPLSLPPVLLLRSVTFVRKSYHFLLIVFSVTQDPSQRSNS